MNLLDIAPWPGPQAVASPPIHQEISKVLRLKMPSSSATTIFFVEI